MENRKEGFNYTYSATKKSEIERIRSKYEPKEEKVDKMEQLRRLDASVSRKATIPALIIGIIGTLIMGTGMCLVMTDLAEYFNLTGNMAMIIGVSVGVFGIIIASLAYPLFSALEKKYKKAVAPEIIRLTDELMKQ